ncbi:hypothetical protein [Anaerosolibacter sp.]|uniref:hypothetical protein n=1 Tax=Anaerosolibacter sp. TaxID=1872527 RepID=UPI0039EEFA0F
MSILAIDLLENYAALLIAIKQGFENADIAFRFLDKAIEDPFCKKGNEIRVAVRRDDLTDEDIKHMIKLRSKNVTYKEIGVFYGLTMHAVYRRIKRYGQKKESVLERGEES